MVRIVEPTKICSVCKHRKPYSDFHRVRSDSEARGSRCKPCDSEHQREYRARNRDRVVRYRQTNYDRVKNDPERYMARLDSGRTSKRRARGTTPDRFRVSRVMREAVAGSMIVVPGGPFASWFRDVMMRDESSIVEASARLGMADKTMREVLKGRRDVELATVERALIADDTCTLRDIYPDLYCEAA